MHVGIISYQTGHLKTLQMAIKFKTKSFKVSIYAFPFTLKEHKPRPFEERPYQILDFDIEGFCKENGIEYIKVDGWDDKHAKTLGCIKDINSPDFFITTIAKIIPKAFIQDRTIINAHPGLLPENRGVDAFKWSIVHSEAIGVSLHVIDERIDAGLLLHKIKVPVFTTDDLKDVAKRAYDMECDLLSNFDYYLDRIPKAIPISDDYFLSKQQIPFEQDSKIEQIFIENKTQLITRANN